MINPTFQNLLKGAGVVFTLPVVLIVFAITTARAKIKQRSQIAPLYN